MQVFNGIDVKGNGSIEGKLVIGGSTLSAESVQFDGGTGSGAQIQNQYGYVNIAPMNNSWAHIYTDRPNFIFNKDVYTVSNGFSSYNNDLLLKRNGVTKLTIGDTLSVLNGDLDARSFKVNSVAIIETDGKIHYNKLKGVPTEFKPADHNHDGIYYTKAENDLQMAAHKSEDAPHTYGGKFEWRFNANTQSLDLVTL